MTEVICPHCDQIIIIDTGSETRFICKYCEEEFIFEQDEQLDLDQIRLSTEEFKEMIPSWDGVINKSVNVGFSQSKVESSEEIELMNGQKDWGKGMGNLVLIPLILMIPLTIAGGAIGFLGGLLFLVGVTTMGALFSSTGVYYGLFFNKTDQTLTCVSSQGRGPWFVDKQVHVNDLIRVELLSWTHRESSESKLNLVGDGWEYEMDALGFNSSLFEEYVDIEFLRRNMN